MVHHDVGNKIAKCGLPIANLFPLTVQKCTRVPDHFPEPAVHLPGIRGDNGGNLRVRCDPVGDGNIGVIHQNRLMGNGIDLKIDTSQVTPFFKSLKYGNIAHLLAGRQQKMLMPADDGGKVGEGCGNFPVDRAPIVGKQYHRTGKLVLFMNLKNGGYRVDDRQCGHIAGQGGCQQFPGGNADDGNSQVVL